MYTLQRIPRLSIVTVASLLATIGTCQAAPLTRVHEVGKSNATHVHNILVPKRDATDVSVERTVRKSRDQGDTVRRQFALCRPACAGRELPQRAVIDRIPRQRAGITPTPRRSCIRRLRPAWSGRTRTIVRGTGSHRGATGTLNRGAPIAFETTWTHHPDLTSTPALGRASGVPFKAVDSGNAVVVDTAGSVIQTADTGSGRATHLGRFSLVAGEHVDLATGAITDGFYTLTAANGDTISGTYSGQALAGLTGYLVSGPVTGGTGHFAGETGFLVWRGTLDPTALTFSDVVTGWMSSPGSPKDELTI